MAGKHSDHYFCRWQAKIVTTINFFFEKNEKNKKCLELPDLARKLIKKTFHLAGGSMKNGASWLRFRCCTVRASNMKFEIERQPSHLAWLAFDFKFHVIGSNNATTKGKPSQPASLVRKITAARIKLFPICEKLQKSVLVSTEIDLIFLSTASNFPAN